jgi:hypothetical protein
MTPPEWIDSSAHGFFGTWFMCTSPFNHRWFCDPPLDGAIRRAQRLEAADPHAASALWARIDRELVDRAATVPLVAPRSIDFVSAPSPQLRAQPDRVHRRPGLSSKPIGARI